MMSNRTIPALLALTLAATVPLAAQPTPASDSTLVIGMLTEWGIIRPEVARTDSGWVLLRTIADYHAVRRGGLALRHRPLENEGTPWRLVVPSEPDRVIYSGMPVTLEDPYFFAWGLLSDYPATGLSPIMGPRVVGAVVPPWVSTPPIEPIDLDAAALDSINLRVAPASVIEAYRVPGPGDVSWIKYRATWPADPRACSMLRREGWIRGTDYDHPQQSWQSENECDTDGKGETWRTPLAVIDEGNAGIVMVREWGWEYSGLRIRILTADSIGPVMPRGW